MPIGVPMKCPVCVHNELKMSERSGVEVDYCPNCRGVWLDRGELDKILDRAHHSAQSAQTPPPPGPPPHHNRGYYKDYYKKRKPWWMEIFD